MIRWRFGTHPESCLHLCLEDVTLQVVWEHRWGGRRVQRLFRQLLLLSLAEEQEGKVKKLGEDLIVSRMGQQQVCRKRD